MGDFILNLMFQSNYLKYSWKYIYVRKITKVITIFSRNSPHYLQTFFPESLVRFFPEIGNKFG